MSDFPKPTAQVEIYVDHLGPDLAVDFLLAFGGAELDFPKSPGERSRLVECVGLERARSLCAAIDRPRKSIPTAKPWLARALKSKGLSQAEIARKLHSTEPTVRKWLNKPLHHWSANPRTPDPDQLSLFPED